MLGVEHRCRAARARARRAWPAPAAARCSPTRRVVSSSSATSVAGHRSTSQRMSTARWRAGRCWSAATKASRIDSRAAATSAGSPSRSITRSSAIGCTKVFSVCGASTAVATVDDGPEVHRAGPALRRPVHVDAHVAGDPVQPRAHRRAALEAVDGLPGAHVGLLHGVLGLGAGAEHPVAEAGELPAVGLELALEVDVDGGHRPRG